MRRCLVSNRILVCSAVGHSTFGLYSTMSRGSWREYRRVFTRMMKSDHCGARTVTNLQAVPIPFIPTAICLGLFSALPETGLLVCPIQKIHMFTCSSPFSTNQIAAVRNGFSGSKMKKLFPVDSTAHEL